MSHLASVVFSRRSLLLGASLMVMAIVSGVTSRAHAQTYPRTFKLTYAWGYASASQVPNIDRWPKVTMKFNQNGSIDGYSETSGVVRPNMGTWTLVGTQLTMQFSSATYVGQQQQDGSFIGTMTNTTGWYGAWKGRFYP